MKRKKVTVCPSSSSDNVSVVKLCHLPLDDTAPVREDGQHTSQEWNVVPPCITLSIPALSGGTSHVPFISPEGMLLKS